MDIRVLGLILLFASTLLTCNAHIIHKHKMRKKCQVEYESRQSCLNFHQRLSRRNCQKLNCCWFFKRKGTNCYKRHNWFS